LEWYYLDRNNRIKHRKIITGSDFMELTDALVFGGQTPPGTASSNRILGWYNLDRIS
jgi:hypothetical protein